MAEKTEAKTVKMELGGVNPASDVQETPRRPDTDRVGQAFHGAVDDPTGLFVQLP